MEERFWECRPVTGRLGELATLLTIRLLNEFARTYFELSGFAETYFRNAAHQARELAARPTTDGTSGAPEKHFD
jgi:hypothetical protein